jgi:hypothetical protein
VRGVNKAAGQGVQQLDTLVAGARGAIDKNRKLTAAGTLAVGAGTATAIALKKDEYDELSQKSQKALLGTTSASTLVAKRDIAGARNRSLTFPSLASCGHVTSFGSAVRETPISAVVSQIVAISAADFALRSISCFTCAIVRSTSPLLMSLPSVIYRGSAARILIP